MEPSANQRGQYGAPAPKEHESPGAGWILALVGISVGIYALSPGARHFYRHGYLPSVKR
jgi:hypothetical protein